MEYVLDIFFLFVRVNALQRANPFSTVPLQNQRFSGMSQPQICTCFLKLFIFISFQVKFLVFLQLLLHQPHNLYLYYTQLPCHMQVKNSMAFSHLLQPQIHCIQNRFFTYLLYTNLRKLPLSNVYSGVSNGYSTSSS